MRVRSLGAVVLAWTVAWSIAGVIAGTLTDNADVPHLPRPLGTILFGVAGALAGSCASLIFLLLQCLPAGDQRPAGWRTVAFAAVAGGLAMLVLAPVIGVPSMTACILGVVAGAPSGFLTAGRAVVRGRSR